MPLHQVAPKVTVNEDKAKCHSCHSFIPASLHVTPLSCNAIPHVPSVQITPKVTVNEGKMRHLLTLPSRSQHLTELTDCVYPVLPYTACAHV